MTTTALKTLVQKSISRETAYVEGAKASDQKDNPQVVATRLGAEGRIEALQAVLNALDGNAFDLKVLAGNI